jgi:hypothetical protein
MVIGDRFAWAHLPKTGGSATLKLFLLFPELVEFADVEDSNAKHTTFKEREREVAGKMLLMNLRRLPHWVLSRAQHVARWGVHPDYEPIPMASPEELAESDFPDNRLLLFIDGGRFQIEKWIRMEHLPEDFMVFVSDLTEVSDDQRAAALDLPLVNSHDYDHEVESWFTAEQIERMYERNPMWAGLEEELYGGHFRPQLAPEGAGGQR